MDLIKDKELTAENHADFALKTRVKTSNRMGYEAQVEVIKKQIGNLESIRTKLHLSQRKMSQLLLVDPSAWSRWIANGEDSAPPHIYRALQWYMTLQEQIPGLNASYFLQKDTESLKKEFRSYAENQIIGLEKTIKNKTQDQVLWLEKTISELKGRTDEMVQHSSRDILKLEDEIVGLREEISKARAELKNSHEQHIKFKKKASLGLMALMILIFGVYFFILK